ncbi:SAP domain-containing protein [Nocardiopsis terrae]|uniref:SAP domain-containing protein n=1 Tax=Streptomyces sp. NPDC057554 TaxID=3350538 RepID=UPI0036B6691F
MDEHRLMDMTLVQLREQCKERGLPITGNKAALAERLTGATTAAPAAEDIDDGDEVFTSDDLDLEHTVTSEEEPRGTEPWDNSGSQPTPDGDTSEPEDELRTGLIEILDLEHSDNLTDQGLLQTVAQRLTDTPGPVLADDETEDAASAYQRGRREAIEAAVKEIIATTGRAGTLTNRVGRLADHARP